VSADVEPLRQVFRVHCGADQLTVFTTPVQSAVR